MTKVTYPHYCPNHLKKAYPDCLKEANDEDELKERFGMRGNIPQSWCRKCRNQKK